MTREKTPPGPARSGADLAKASMAPNTRRAYEGALRGFEGSDYPETDAGVAAYLGELYDHGRSAAVAAMAVAALRFRARHQGRDSPVGPEAERALAGFRRMAAERGYGQVAGVRWEQADRVAEMAEEAGGPAGLRDAAIIAVASDALLRVSEISALDIDDVDLEEQTVLIRRSKTDQEGAGAVQFLGEPTVARVRAWLLGASLTQGALFRSLYKGGRLRTGRLTREEHAPHHHPPRPGRRSGGPHQRTQPARGQRAEPGHRRGLPGRDATRGALVLAGHAGALRPGTTRETRRRGEAALRPVSARRNGGFAGRPSTSQGAGAPPQAGRQGSDFWRRTPSWPDRLPAGMRGNYNESACVLITCYGRRITDETGKNGYL